MNTVKIEDLPRNDELTAEEMKSTSGGNGSNGGAGSHVMHGDIQILKYLDKASTILF